jgi:hypothetical protein
MGREERTGTKERSEGKAKNGNGNETTVDSEEAKRKDHGTSISYACVGWKSAIACGLSKGISHDPQEAQFRSTVGGECEEKYGEDDDCIHSGGRSAWIARTLYGVGAGRSRS